jgi:hypothetical protein
VYDRFGLTVVSFAILADDEPNWRPSRFEYGSFGSTCGLTFAAVKLWDWIGRETVLEQHSNPFALVILAHLRALQTRNDPAGRLNWKMHLVHLLYQRGMDARDVRRLFRFIDWLLDLPPTLNRIFWNDVEQIEKENRMPFVTTPERLAREDAFKTAIRAFLTYRFGSDSEGVLVEIDAMTDRDYELLEKVFRAIPTINHPDQLRSLWASEQAGPGNGDATTAP